MRIGVDCHTLSGKFQGSRTYLLNLYRSVTAQHPSHEFIFYGHWNGNQPFGQSVTYKPFPSESRWRRLTFETHSMAKADRLDLYHTTYVAPLMLPCRSLVTVHDVLFETAPEYFTTLFVWRSRLLVRHSVRNAAQIHTISRFSKDMIASRYRVAHPNIRLVPAGIDLQRFYPHDKESARKIARTEYGVSDFILTVGRLEPRKNHVGLIEAYARVRQAHPHVGPLVLVGQRDFGYDLFFKRMAELGLADNVLVLSDIPDAMLPLLYRAARIFVYPSFAEGFGIPVLEAMASGTPVVVSNTTAMPEIVGDSGLLVDPKDPEDIANAVTRLLDDSRLAASNSERGYQQAQHWTWESAAALYLQSISELENSI